MKNEMEGMNRRAKSRSLLVIGQGQESPAESLGSVGLHGTAPLASMPATVAEMENNSRYKFSSRMAISPMFGEIAFELWLVTVVTDSKGLVLSCRMHQCISFPLREKAASSEVHPHTKHVFVRLSAIVAELDHVRDSLLLEMHTI